jgi:hypothetical protein
MLDTKDKKQTSSRLSNTIASIKVQTVKEVAAASSFNMSCRLTALWMAGKISLSPFNERYEQHTIVKLSQCQRYTRYPHQKG